MATGGTLTDVAGRVWAHGWRSDPICRSLLDTDFYKLLMLQQVWRRHRDVPVTFAMRNRTTSARLADEVDEGALREQLDHARTVSLTRGESTWLRGNTFYGRRQIFGGDFVDWLEGLRLPAYELARTGDGQYALTFSGPWAEVTLWEIVAMSVVNELRSRRALAGMGLMELDTLYARAKARLWDKVATLAPLAREGLVRVSDFGTRRRHSFLWHRWAVAAAAEGLGRGFVGTSNALLAKDHDLEAIGTNAHELPMVAAALADGDEALAASPYGVLAEWQADYFGNLLVALPDTFGTTRFLRDAPDWVADWRGFRPDSKDPIEAGEEIVAWWLARGRDPRDKLLVFADGMDAARILEVEAHFRGRVGTTFGWGTNLTNDFRGLAPDRPALGAISLVCKVASAGGRPAVKLSDNASKATGEPAEVRRYLRVFGDAGMGASETLV